MLRFFLSPLATASVSAARGASQRAGAAALSLGQCVSPPDTPHRASFCARRPPATLPAPPLFLPRRFSRGYHANVLDHYENPRNVGALDKGSRAVGTGVVGAPACGDVMKLQVRGARASAAAGGGTRPRRRVAARATAASPPSLRRAAADPRGRRRPHRRGQVQDVWLRLRHCVVVGGHRVGHRQDAE